MKTIKWWILAGVILFGAPVGAQQLPNLSREQRECLESQLGRPGQAQRPDSERMRAVFENCGVQLPQGPAAQFLRHLTLEQRACMESRIGSPTSGSRPSRELLESALADCGVQRPQPPSRWHAPAFESSRGGVIR